MTSAEITSLMAAQKKKSRPLKFFIVFNILLSFMIAVYLLIVGIAEGNSGVYEQTIELVVMPEVLNEAGDKPGEESKPESGQNQEQEEEEAKPGQVLDPKQKKWNEAFAQYAQKITVKNINQIHELNFDLAPAQDLPINSGDLDVAFEVYDKDKEYLFTFYANYWHEDGYDEGEYWHERSYRDSTYSIFPYAGDFYIVAGIPAGNPAMFEKVNYASGSKVKLHIFSNSKPFPVSSVMGFFFFVTLGIILINTRRFFTQEKRLQPYNFIYFNPEFNLYHYIVKVEDKFYYLNGINRVEGNSNSVELVLDQDGTASFLELEREYEDGETEFYAHLYDFFPEDDFAKIPNSEELTYCEKNFKSPDLNAAAKKVTMTYSNGLSEEALKTEIYFETAEDNPYYLAFEYADNPDDFDVAYGRPVYAMNVWRIKK